MKNIKFNFICRSSPTCSERRMYTMYTTGEEADTKGSSICTEELSERMEQDPPTICRLKMN